MSSGKNSLKLHRGKKPRRKTKRVASHPPTLFCLLFTILCMWNIIRPWLWNGFILYNFAQLRTCPGWTARKSCQFSHASGQTATGREHMKANWHITSIKWFIHELRLALLLIDWLRPEETIYQGFNSPPSLSPAALFNISIFFCFYVLHSASLSLSFVCLATPVIFPPLLSPAHSAYKILMSDSLSHWFCYMPCLVLPEVHRVFKRTAHTSTTEINATYLKKCHKNISRASQGYVTVGISHSVRIG